MNGVAIIPLGNIQYPLFLTRASIRLLKKEVSPPFYRSLENIWDMMKTEVFIPLSLARDEKDFLERAKKVLPQFSRLRIAMAGLFLSHYAENLEKLQDEMAKLLFQLERDIEKKGEKYIEITNLLRLKSVLHTALGISRRAFQWFINRASPEETIAKIAESKDFLNFFNTTTQLDLFLTFIFSVLEGDIEPIKRHLVNTALNEADSYANKYFHYVKKFGILAPPKRMKVSFPEKLSEEDLREDRELTEALMENFKKSLERDEDG